MFNISCKELRLTFVTLVLPKVNRYYTWTKPGSIMGGMFVGICTGSEQLNEEENVLRQ